MRLRREVGRRAVLETYTPKGIVSSHPIHGAKNCAGGRAAAPGWSWQSEDAQRGVEFVGDLGIRCETPRVQPGDVSNPQSSLLRRGRLLEAATLGWNVIGVFVLAFAAIAARSVALAGFGLDSLIEIGASLVVLWELADVAAERQRRAMRLIGGAFVLLSISWGEALLDADTGRIGPVEALSLDEVAFARIGERQSMSFATTICDNRRGQLLDVVPGRGGAEPKAWLKNRSQEWRAGVTWATLDLSSAFRSVFTAELPEATLVADPFHVVKHANSKLDECRRRVQNETLGHRGRKSDPLYRSRRLLTMAKQRLSGDAEDKMVGLLKASDPKGEVAVTWHAKEAVRELYAHADEATAAAWIDQLIIDMADKSQPIDVRSLGRTLKNWRNEIIAWHRSHASNGPTEAVNNLVKRVKRAAFGFRSFKSFRIRSLLYAGKPNWSLLETVMPR